MARDIAPTACPKCGNENAWRAITDPNNTAKKAIVSGIGFALFGRLGGALGSTAKGNVTYRCAKCGFTEKYRED